MHGTIEGMSIAGNRLITRCKSPLLLLFLLNWSGSFAGDPTVSLLFYPLSPPAPHWDDEAFQAFLYCWLPNMWALCHHFFIDWFVISIHTHMQSQGNQSLLSFNLRQTWLLLTSTVASWLSNHQAHTLPELESHHVCCWQVGQNQCIWHSHKGGALFWRCIHTGCQSAEGAEIQLAFASIRTLVPRQYWGSCLDILPSC